MTLPTSGAIHDTTGAWRRDDDDEPIRRTAG
jgi:hypothetical protein